MSYISDKVNQILIQLQSAKQRCTYGALADLVGTSPRDVSVFLAPKRPEASWVVNKKTGQPTGYEAYQIHPELETNPEILATSADLERFLQQGS